MAFPQPFFAAPAQPLVRAYLRAVHGPWWRVTNETYADHLPGLALLRSAALAAAKPDDPATVNLWTMGPGPQPAALVDAGGDGSSARPLPPPGGVAEAVAVLGSGAGDNDAATEASLGRVLDDARSNGLAVFLLVGLDG
ncbi:hypothetical protein CDD83_11036 [Cordyceps sp. RAO-2017]|nr:hypothetical protein CDD83_11036 [Cordyceps sp. RAO-2017]